MLVNAFLFDVETDPDDPKLILVQKVDQGNKWALPGGRNRKGEVRSLEVGCRETTEEVGPEAAKAVLDNWFDEVVIKQRGGYNQHIFVAPFAGKLRKKGLKETDEKGLFTEKLGPPTWVSFEDVRRGIVTVGKNFYEIYPLHMNAIHEAFAAIADLYPELKPIAEDTKVFAWN